MTTEIKKYKSKQFDCWNKAKELRLDYYHSMAKSREPGSKTLLVSGGGETCYSLIAGLGDFEYLSGEPYAASQAHDWNASLACLEEVEKRGWAVDLCSYMRNYWGAMYLNKYYFGGPFPKPDFYFQLHFCDTHAKWYQVASEYYGGVPYFSIDFPIGPKDRRQEDKIEYLVSQMYDAIDWMQKVTKRKYDDEKLIKAVTNEIDATSLWAQLMNYNKNIPAPIDQKSVYSFYNLTINSRHKDETVEFNKILRDEMKDRVDNEIAALATERFRILDDSQPPWHTLRIFRYLEQYGCIDIGSPYSINLMGNWIDHEDGTFEPAKTLKESGVVLRNKDEALRALADITLKRVQRFFNVPWERRYDFVKIARDWKADGVMIHLNRGCEGFACGQLDCRQALIDAEIPVLTFEGNMADKRDFDENQTYRRIDAFMEGQGLKPLES